MRKLSSQTQESYPLITYSKAADLLGDSSQCATDSKFHISLCWNMHFIFLFNYEDL